MEKTQKVKLDLLCVEEPQAVSKDDSFIFVTDFNDTAMANFYKTFLRMINDPTVKIIPVIISSYGGEVYSLLPMLDLIASSTKPVATIALGKAMSCGAVLLAAGTPGLRFASPTSEIMIHEVDSGVFGKTTEINGNVKQINKLNNILLRKLSKYAKKKDKLFFKRELKKRTNVDWYLSAKECMAHGLIDHVGIPNLLKAQV